MPRGAPPNARWPPGEAARARDLRALVDRRAALLVDALPSSKRNVRRVPFARYPLTLPAAAGATARDLR